MVSKRRTLSGAALLASIIVLSACDPGGGNAPGAVSQGEAQALEEAAEMLEERRLPEGTLPPIDVPVAEVKTGEAPAEIDTADDTTTQAGTE